MPILREVDGQTQSVTTTTTTTTSSNGEAVAKGASFGERQVRVTTSDKALTVSSWHRGLALIGDTMGMMPVQYQKLNREGGNFVEDVSDAPGSYLSKLSK